MRSLTTSSQSASTRNTSFPILFLFLIIYY
nr:MAG TPA: hypothetical protein [Caudoviricetes sp.]